MDSTPRLSIEAHLQAAARLWCEQNPTRVVDLSHCYSTSDNPFVVMAENASTAAIAAAYEGHLSAATPDDPLPDGWAVYHLIGHDERILYIGMTGNPRQRISAHRLEFGHHICRVEWYPCENRVLAYELEGERIALHRPPFNVARVPS